MCVRIFDPNRLERQRSVHILRQLGLYLGWVYTRQVDEHISISSCTHQNTPKHMCSPGLEKDTPTAVKREGEREEQGKIMGIRKI